MSNREVTIVKLRVMALLGLAGVTVLALARADAAGGVICREPRPKSHPRSDGKERRRRKLV